MQDYNRFATCRSSPPATPYVAASPRGGRCGVVASVSLDVVDSSADDQWSRSTGRHSGRPGGSSPSVSSPPGHHPGQHRCGTLISSDGYRRSPSSCSTAPTARLGDVVEETSRRRCRCVSGCQGTATSPAGRTTFRGPGQHRTGCDPDAVVILAFDESQGHRPRLGPGSGHGEAYSPMGAPRLRQGAPEGHPRGRRAPSPGADTSQGQGPGRRLVPSGRGRRADRLPVAGEAYDADHLAALATISGGAESQTVATFRGPSSGPPRWRSSRRSRSAPTCSPPGEMLAPVPSGVGRSTAEHPTVGVRRSLSSSTPTTSPSTWNQVGRARDLARGGIGYRAHCLGTPTRRPGPSGRGLGWCVTWAVFRLLRPRGHRLRAGGSVLMASRLSCS